MTMDQQLARVRLLSSRFLELQGLRVALAGATIAVVFGGYLAIGHPTDTGGLIAMGATLRMNPLLILVVTISAGAFFGMLGMVLAAPLTSAAIHVTADLRKMRSPLVTPPAPAADAPPG